MAGLIQDLKYGARGLLKERGFTIVAVLTLAIGIGANTAVYSLTDQILMRRLPVRSPEELVVLSMPGSKSGHVWSDIEEGAQSFSYPFYEELRAGGTEVFGGLLARFSTPLSVAGQGRTERANGELVSGDYFEVLGVPAALGRVLAPDDERVAGGAQVAVLSHGYWTRRFGANPAVVNQSLVVNGRTFTVVGVAAAGFQGVQLGETPDLFVPITLKAQMTPNWDGLRDRKDYWLQMVGRLRQGMTRSRAEAGLRAIARPLLERDVAVITGLTAEKRQRFLAKAMVLVPGAQGRLVLQQDTRDGLLLLSGLVGLLLLIACANVANLLIARGAARRREIAVRLALGAQRIHLMRQLLVESLMLCVAGGAAGLLVAAWSIDSMFALFPRDGSMAALSSRLDLRMLAFNFGVALATGLVFGLLPALRTTRADLVSAIKDQSAGAGTGAAHVRLRKALVVAQISVTAVLLVTAGLFITSVSRLQAVDLGLRAENVVAFSVEPELNGYTPSQTLALVDRIRRDLASLPAVTNASAAEIAVLTDSTAGSNATLEGARPEDDVRVSKNWVGPKYFTTLGVPVLRGREIAESDTAAAPKVALINEAMERKYFASRDPIGLHFAFGSGNGVKPDIEIVGVVKNLKHATVKDDENPFVYLPYAQDPALGESTFYVRSAQPAAAIATAVRETVRRCDPNLPVFGMKTLLEQRDESLSGERMLRSLSVCFAVVAALLAAIGLYGTMAYTVLRRTPEIGIRMALGANARNVRFLVLREAMTMAAIGLAIGLPAALGAGRLARSLLFGVQPGEPLLLLVAGLLLAGMMLAAAYIPARRATRVDPLIALRSE